MHITIVCSFLEYQYLVRTTLFHVISCHLTVSISAVQTRYMYLCNQCRTWCITKTCLYNFDPLKPHFYIVKLGFTGVYIIYFLFLLENIDCGYSLEPPHRGGSNKYPQSMFWAEIWKISEFFLSENFQFLEVEFSIYLNRRVFVMRRLKMSHLLRMRRLKMSHLLRMRRLKMSRLMGIYSVCHSVLIFDCHSYL